MVVTLKAQIDFCSDRLSIPRWIVDMVVLAAAVGVDVFYVYRGSRVDVFYVKTTYRVVYTYNSKGGEGFVYYESIKREL